SDGGGQEQGWLAAAEDWRPAAAPQPSRQDAVNDQRPVDGEHATTEQEQRPGGQGVRLHAPAAPPPGRDGADSTNRRADDRKLDRERQALLGRLKEAVRKHESKEESP